MRILQRFHRVLLAAAVVGVGADPAPAHAQRPDGFVVIVSEGSPLRTVTRDQVSQLFLKRETRLPNGRTAMPVDLDGGNKVRAAFTSAVHRRSVVAINSYWQQQIFAGREVPPPTMTSERDIVAFVRANPDAVGYVASSTDLGRGVRPVSLAP